MQTPPDDKQPGAPYPPNRPTTPPPVAYYNNNMPVTSSAPVSTPTVAPRGWHPGLATLPLRLFLGITFVAAALDKLTEPDFFNPAGAGYIGNQLAGFAKLSPIGGFLTSVVVPNATLFGAMILAGELAIGIGVLLGLFTRQAAFSGMLISLTLWIATTWSVTPFYFSSDIPYALGWLTLALAGAYPALSLDGLLSRWWAKRRAASVAPGLGGAAVAGGALAVGMNGTPGIAVAQEAGLARRRFLTVAGATLFAGAVTGVAWANTLAGKSQFVSTAEIIATPLPEPVPTAPAPTIPVSAAPVSPSAITVPETTLPATAGTTPTASASAVPATVEVTPAVTSSVEATLSTTESAATTTTAPTATVPSPTGTTSLATTAPATATSRATIAQLPVASPPATTTEPRPTIIPPTARPLPPPPATATPVPPPPPTIARPTAVPVPPTAKAPPANTLINLNNLAKGSGITYITPDTRQLAWLIRTPGGQITSVVDKCTHQGCEIDYVGASNRLFCACHGSEFAPTGEVLRGPAQRNLKTFRVEVDASGNVIYRG